MLGWTDAAICFSSCFRVFLFSRTNILEEDIRVQGQSQSQNRRSKKENCTQPTHTSRATEHQGGEQWALISLGKILLHPIHNKCRGFRIGGSISDVCRIQKYSRIGRGVREFWFKLCCLVVCFVYFGVLGEYNTIKQRMQFRLGRI
jgi:hypothetical protein